jgi:xylose isomerase
MSSSFTPSASYFPSISKILYNPNASATETLVYRHYNADEIIMGRKMSEWLKFSMCFWHTFRGVGQDPFGTPTIQRPWEDASLDALTLAKHRMHAAFEFMTKLGIEYYTFHDRDISPEGKDLKETNANLDVISDIALELQKKTGIQCLWGTANLFTHSKFMNGASTNPDAAVFAHAAVQVKKAMEITYKLSGTSYVFWGGREGFMSLLNTDMKRELDHMAKFLKMAVDYKQKLGFNAQLLIEPKPKEPTKHQYDYDAATVIGFLHEYGLHSHYKLNIEPNHTTLAGHAYEHDVAFARRFGMLGSIDANTGDQSLGWDTDQFPMNTRDTTLIMLEVLGQNGFAPGGGLNFDCKVRRESNEIADMFIAHLAAMDAFAVGLRTAAKIQTEGLLSKLVAQRYESYDADIGAKIEKGTTNFEELEAWVLKNGENLVSHSGRQESYEQLLNHYLHCAK